MLKTIALCIGVTACATGSPVTQTHFTTSPHVDLAAAPATFPARRTTPDLPSAAPFSPRLIAEGPMSARVHLCVSPAGDTASVELEESSGDRRFDRAVLDDVARWRYEPNTTARALACERATVKYVP